MLNQNQKIEEISIFLRKSLLILFLGSFLYASSQNMEEVKYNLHKLTSKSFAGRGYVKNGGIKAAKFIKKKFQSYGLQTINDSYFQNYTFAVNTYPSKVHLSVNNIDLIAGQDFVVKSNSSSSSGNFPCLYLPLNDEQKEADLSNTFLVGNKDYKELSKENLFHAKGFLFLQEKQPIWSVYGSSDTSQYTVFAVDENSLKDSVISISYKFKNKYYSQFETQNIWGIIKGKTYPDSLMIITAHYDHLGMMGNVMYPGANDNASGTSMVMALAEYFAQKQNQPEISLMFALFSGEEAGLMGSKYMADHLPFPQENIQLVINLDMVATGSDGITMVNGKQYPEILQSFQEINQKNDYLKEVKARGESCNSDHCPFYEKGIPAVFIYTRGPEATAYHIPQDTYESLPLTEFEDLFRLVRDYIGM
jgi:hypothetical protein